TSCNDSDPLFAAARDSCAIAKECMPDLFAANYDDVDDCAQLNYADERATIEALPHDMESACRAAILHYVTCINNLRCAQGDQSACDGQLNQYMLKCQ